MVGCTNIDREYLMLHFPVAISKIPCGCSYREENKEK